MTKRTYMVILTAVAIAVLSFLFYIGYSTRLTSESIARVHTRWTARNIMIAIQQYTNDYGAPPPRVLTIVEQGKSLRHSWRALLLPYLTSKEQAALYDYHKTWDDAQNIAAARTIGAFSLNADTSTTAVFSIVRTTDSSETQGDCTGGVAPTVLAVVISGSRGLWSRPVDVSVDEVWDAVSSKSQVVDAIFVGGCIVSLDGIVRNKQECIELLECMSDPTPEALLVYARITSSAEIAERDKTCFKMAVAGPSGKTVDEPQ